MSSASGPSKVKEKSLECLQSVFVECEECFLDNFLYYLEIVHVNAELLKLSGMECERQYMFFLSWPKGLLKSLWHCLH